MVQTAEAPRGDTARDVVTRWGGDPIVNVEGFVPVPSVFLRHLSRIRPRITPTEALFVLELMLYKWGERAPFPALKTIAEQMGVSETYARKLARSLEKKRLMRRIWRTGTTSEYDLQPLFDALSARVKRHRAEAQAQAVGA